MSTKKVTPQTKPTNSNIMENPGSVPEFIQKLFRMLENQAFENTFCWGRDGTTFIVKDTNQFSKTILPKHFKHCNFASFVRQLNKYDFHKVRNGDDGQKLYGEQVWEFVHPKFIRDRKDLLEDIKRKSPGIKIKKEETMTALKLNIANTKQTDAMTSTLSSDSLQEIRNIGLNLQSQIDQLKKSRSVMEANISQLKHKDTRIMTELVEFNEVMTAKDNLIKGFLELVTEKEQQTPIKSQQAQKLLESYTRISQNNIEHMKYLKEKLSHVEPNTVKQENPINKSILNLQNQIPSLAAAVVDGDPETASAAAAAASMNAGSLIGSPLKTADGLTFVTLGRLSSSMSVRDNKPAIEIMAADQTPTLATTLQRPSKRKSPSPLSSSNPQSQVSWTVPPRILLVDDDSVYRDLSRKLLSVIGCTIDLATDGVEALKKMGIRKYDLILMDIVMPKMDGISATRSIRQYDALTPIISMTSNFTDNDIMQYIGSGMTDILPKPFSKRTLYQMLEKYCAHLKSIQRVQGFDSDMIPQQPQQALGLVPMTGSNNNDVQEPSTSSTHSSPALSQPPPPHLYPSVQCSSTTSTNSNTSNSTPSAFPLAPYPYPVTMNSVPTDISSGDFNHVTNSDIPNVTFWPQQQSQQQDPPPAIIPNDGKFTWAVPTSNTTSQELPHQQSLFDPVAVAINESNKRHRMDHSSTPTSRDES